MENIINKIQGTIFTNEIFEDKEFVKMQLMNKINRRSKLHILRISFSVAASILLLCTLTYSIFFSTVTYSTSKNEHLLVVLPDKSTVNLNGETTISYNRLKWFKSKDVNLKGEAYFCVTKGAGFKVITDLGEISVLGTKFNVNCYSNELLVRCDEGRVQVETPEGIQILTPKQKVTATKGKSIVKQDIDPPLPKFLEYNNVPLATVVKRLGEVYRINFSTKNSYDNIYFSGLIPTNNLTQALEIISASCELSYIKKGNTITFTASNE